VSLSAAQPRNRSRAPAGPPADVTPDPAHPPRLATMRAQNVTRLVDRPRRGRLPRVFFEVRRRAIGPHRTPACVRSGSHAPAIAFHATRHSGRRPGAFTSALLLSPGRSSRPEMRRAAPRASKQQQVHGPVAPTACARAVRSPRGRRGFRGSWDARHVDRGARHARTRHADEMVPRRSLPGWCRDRVGRAADETSRPRSPQR
jgi:hypothetical protein